MNYGHLSTLQILQILIKQSNLAAEVSTLIACVERLVTACATIFGINFSTFVEVITTHFKLQSVMLGQRDLFWLRQSHDKSMNCVMNVSIHQLILPVKGFRPVLKYHNMSNCPLTWDKAPMHLKKCTKPLKTHSCSYFLCTYTKKYLSNKLFRFPKIRNSIELKLCKINVYSTVTEIKENERESKKWGSVESFNLVTMWVFLDGWWMRNKQVIEKGSSY